VWLLFLAFPAVGLWEMRTEPWRLLPAAASMLAFAAVYPWAANRAIRALVGVGPALGLPALRAVLGLLLALGVSLPLAYGENFVGMLGFVAILVGLTLSPRAVVAASVAVVLLTAATAAVSGIGWGPALSITVYSGLAGPIAYGARRLVETNAELRTARGEVARLAVVEERLRLSREIHDTLAQGFTGILTQATPARRALADDPAAAGRHLDQIERTAREGLSEARRLVWGLRPEPLRDATLPEALERLAARFGVETDIAARVSVAGAPEPLAPEVEVTLLRAAQEALENVRKHAGAGRVALTLSFLEDAVALDVRDDGRGFDPARPTAGGAGLKGMRERVGALGGTLHLESSPGGGATLAVELPMDGGAPRRGTGAG
jgi:signal transduction histidine kinase